MKYLSMLFALLFVVGIVVAQDKPAEAKKEVATKVSGEKAMKSKKHAKKEACCDDGDCKDMKSKKEAKKEGAAEEKKAETK